MITKIEKIFGPTKTLHPNSNQYLNAWVGSDIDDRPCQSGNQVYLGDNIDFAVMSETTECDHCQFGCKVDFSNYVVDKPKAVLF